MKPAPFEGWTSESLEKLREQPRSFQAQALDARARQIEEATKRNFIELGLICLFVEEHELWTELADENGNPYRSWEHWVTNAVPYSRSHAFDAKAQLKIIRDNHIPVEQVEQIPRCNLRQLTKLSSAVMRDPEVQQKAATLSEAEFNKEIRDKYPSQHFEEKLPMRFYPTASQREKIDAALVMVSELMGGGMSREDALESLCADFVEEHRDEWELRRNSVETAVQ